MLPNTCFLRTWRKDVTPPPFPSKQFLIQPNQGKTDLGPFCAPRSLMEVG